MPTAEVPSAAVDGAFQDDELENDSLVTGEAVRLGLRPAPFAFRAASAAIDQLLSWLVFGGLALLYLQGVSSGVLSLELLAPLVISTVVLCFLVGPMLVELLSRGRSVGRIALGLRIVRDDGGAEGVRQAFVRAAVGFVEFFVLLGGPAAIVGALTRRSKRLGDLLAGTFAQYERLGRRPAPLFGVPVPLLEWAATADVGRLPDPLARRIRQFLQNAPRLDRGRRALIAAALANETAPWVSPVPRADAELFLAAVVVLRREREARALATEAERLALLAPALERLPRGLPDRG